MSLRTRAQNRGITSLNASDEASARPSPTIPQDKGCGSQGKPQGHSLLAKGEGAENVEGRVRALSLSKLMA